MPKAGVQSFPRGLVNIQDKILFVAADTLKDNLGIAYTSMYSIDLCGATTSNIDIFGQYDELAIFPNPAKDFINLGTSEPIESLGIFSLSGNLILKKSHPEKQIEVTGLSNGIYIIQAHSLKKTYTSKFLIAR